jgi:hypothetical protein
MGLFIPKSVKKCQASVDGQAVFSLLLLNKLQPMITLLKKVSHMCHNASLSIPTFLCFWTDFLEK